jgi:tetratricopeptide (TPR) repeat protein
MAEDVKKRPRRSRAAAPTTPDPIEIAMEALAAGQAEPGSPAHRVLLRHEQLIGWQIMKERAGFALRCLTGIVGIIFAVGLGSLVWSASQERGLVIEPFSVPPEFAEKGVTGQVIASRLLDRLSEMSDQTQSVRAPSTYANNWNGDIKVQIPQTGVSVGELRRYLVEWLGQQTTIGGELYRTPDGLSLIARTGTATATPQAGADERALDAMIQAAAEQVYAATQPYRYAVYLGRRGDADGAARSETALRALTRSTDEADRIWAYAGLNLSLQAKGEIAGAIEAADAALAIDPDFTLGYANRAGARRGLGHAEAALQDNRMAYRTARSDGRRFMGPEGLAFLTAAWQANVRLAVGDYGGAVEPVRRSLELRPGDLQQVATLAVVLGGLHEPSAARAELAQLSPPPPEASPEVLAAWKAFSDELAGATAYAAGGWSEVARLLGGIDISRMPPPVQASRRIALYPPLATALARMGETDRAAALVATTPTGCYDCVIARAVVAETRGDRAGADRWYAEAIRQGPSLPFAHEARGRARLARGDLEGALADFREASRRSPRWADPLTGWADALMAEGDARGAIGKYSAAAERAPGWGRLHLAWGRALAAEGQAAPAREQYRRASRMDLTGAERAAVTRLLAGRT